MNATKIPAGKYVIAVSGGIDSVVLLDLLTRQKNLELVVAHFDHGIRADSEEDARFVAALAQTYGLPIYARRQELGPGASEALARDRRYVFLKTIQKEVGGQAIITAHHQDDLIETACLNLLRGTKRRGLVSLRSTAALRRPLLDITKQEIREYAIRNHLEWCEDSTNSESCYLRNKLRKKIAPRLNASLRIEIIELLKTVGNQNDAINDIVAEYLKQQPGTALAKGQLLQLEAHSAYEIVASWLRLRNVSFDTTAIVRIINGARTLQNGSQIDVQAGWYCVVKKDEITLTRR